MLEKLVYKMCVVGVFICFKTVRRTLEEDEEKCLPRYFFFYILFKFAKIFTMQGFNNVIVSLIFIRECIIVHIYMLVLMFDTYEILVFISIRYQLKYWKVWQS
jgi:hypothetical protein